MNYSDDVLRLLDTIADLEDMERANEAEPCGWEWEEQEELPYPDADAALAVPLGHDGPIIFDLGDMRTLLFNWTIVQSGMRISDPTTLIFDYTKMMMSFLFFNARPMHIEMIGLGGGSLAKYCHRHLPASRLRVIEIDPDVVGLRRDFAIPDDDDRLAILCGDGAKYVRDDLSRPDIILVDGFDERGQPPQLCSSQFYEDCFNRLNQGGLLVVNLCDDHHAYPGYITRLKLAFGKNLLVVPAECEANRVIFARRGQGFSVGAAELRRAALDLEDCHPLSFTDLAERVIKVIGR